MRWSSALRESRLDVRDEMKRPTFTLLWNVNVGCRSFQLQQQDRMPPPSLRQQVRHGDALFRSSEGGDVVPRCEDQHVGVAVTVVLRGVGDGPAVDLQLLLNEIYDPVVRDAGAGVQ